MRSLLAQEAVIGVGCLFRLLRIARRREDFAVSAIRCDAVFRGAAGAAQAELNHQRVEQQNERQQERAEARRQRSAERREYCQPLSLHARKIIRYGLDCELSVRVLGALHSPAREWIG
jgi:hypothetical protein